MYTCFIIKKMQCENYLEWPAIAIEVNPNQWLRQNELADNVTIANADGGGNGEDRDAHSCADASISKRAYWREGKRSENYRRPM